MGSVLLSFLPAAVAVVLLLSTAAVSHTQPSSTAFENDNPIRLPTDGGLRDWNLSSVLALIPRSRHALSFARFLYKYGKSYETLHELKFRFQVFSENMKLIKSSNSRGLSYTLALNQFSDLTWEEFSKHKLGAAQNCSATRGNHPLTNDVLPEAKDWRNEGIVSPVKDQGHCGSCWTFSTTGSLEAAYAQAFGKSISLSEQQLVDCAGAFNNFGCNGGLPSQAFEYIKYNGGLETEESYPYTAKGGSCNYSSENVGVRLLSSINITLGAEDELKHAVAFVRPVSVAFEVMDDFRFYKTGVYSREGCGATSMDVNHAVVAVGYGIEGGMGYWIIKNSWGGNWGSDGYFKMEMGKNMCGIATCASYPIML